MDNNELGTNLAEVGTDCISRQQAIGAMGKAEWAKERLRALPSAQPEINCSEFPNNSDTISRQAVKEILEKNQMPYHVYPYVWDAINALPPAQPKRGKWIEIEAFDDSRYVKCDQCKTVQVFYYGKRNTNFCPNCGADMRGEQDE